MKNDCRTLGIKKLCALFGKTRHAYYDREWQLEEKTIEYAIVLKLVDQQRRIMPRIGTPKIYELIKDDIEKHNIKLGRDKLHELLSFYDLTVKKKRRRTINHDVSSLAEKISQSY